MSAGETGELYKYIAINYIVRTHKNSIAAAVEYYI